LAGQDRIKSYVKQKMIIEIVDPSISKEGIELDQLLAFIGVMAPVGYLYLYLLNYAIVTTSNLMKSNGD
jgi:hypothetical protein